MPKLLPRQYAKILYAVTRNEKKIDAAVTAFVKFLQRRRAIKKLPAIIKEFLYVSREAEGIQSVRVTAARSMPENKIIEQVKKLLVLNGVEGGSEVEVEMNVDETIVGGIVVETRTRRIDASVKNQLSQLSNHLVQKK